MAKQETLVIPAGLKLESTAEGVSVEHEGDIVLNSAPGSRLGRLLSRSGDVILNVDLDVVAIEAPKGSVIAHAALKVNRLSASSATFAGELTAESVQVEGTLTFNGNVAATRVRGETVHFNGASVVVRSAEGERSVHVGKTRLQADILIAPSVLLDPSATGRVKVLESHNELGAHAVRGCLRLADLEDMGGNAAAFLAERGLKPLGEPTLRPGAPVPSPVVPEPAQVAEPVRVAPPEPVRAPPPPPVVPVAAPVPLPVSSPLRTLGSEQLDTLTGDDSAPLDPVQRDIREALDKIVACYADGDLPPPIADLRDSVLQRDYGVVRDSIMQVWNQTLAWHKRYGPPRIHPQLSPNFNILNSLVRKL